MFVHLYHYGIGDFITAIYGNLNSSQILQKCPKTDKHMLTK